MLFPEATPFPDNCFLPAWTATRRVRARHEEPQDIRRRLVPDARLAPTAYATRSGIEHHLSERTARAANVENAICDIPTPCFSPTFQLHDRRLAVLNS